MRKLDAESVHQIRLLYETKKNTQVELAKKFGVSQPLISKIVNKAIYCDDFNVMMTGKANVKVGYRHGN